MKNNNQPVSKKELRKTLGEFSEEILLPAVREIIGEESNKLKHEIAKSKHELKEYIDEKNADLRGDIIVFLRKVIEELQLFPYP